MKEVGLLKKFFAVVLVIFCAAAVLMFASCNKTEDNEESTVDSNEDENGYIDTEAALADVQGIKILNYYTDSGVFVENGSDIEKENPAGIEVYNDTEKTLQYMELKADYADGTEYTYKISLLPPGETCYVFESSGAEYKDASHMAVTWSSESCAFFSEEPKLHEDMFTFSGTAGIINITNNTVNDIDGDVIIYYKNIKDGELYGGIAYRAVIEGGIKSGETKQVAAGHYSNEGSMIMFTEIIDTEEG